MDKKKLNAIADMLDWLTFPEMETLAGKQAIIDTRAHLLLVANFLRKKAKEI